MLSWPYNIIPPHPHTFPMYRPKQLQVEWKTNYEFVQVEPFTEATGPTTAIPTAISEIFQLFFSLGILQHIVDQTNLYASQVMGDSQFATWEQVTIEELKELN